MISESTTMTELLDASGVGTEYNRQNQERWYEPPKQKVYLVCKLDCPWGYDGYGNTTVKCNCRDGWPKKTKFGKLEKRSSWEVYFVKLLGWKLFSELQYCFCNF